LLVITNKVVLRAKKKHKNKTKMPRKSNKAEAEALKNRLEDIEKRMKTLVENLGKAVTDKNKITTTILLAQLKDKEKKWSDIGKEYVSKLQLEEAEYERERQEDIVDAIIEAKVIAELAHHKETTEDMNKEILDTVIESLTKLNEKKSEHNTFYTTTPALPSLKFPTFTGEYEKWTPWWNQFNTVIHSNTRIHPMDKFNFLRSYTDGRAAEVIQKLDTTPENYESAIEILKNRYEKPDLLQASHVNAIIALNPVNSSSDYKCLRSLHNQLMCHITSLESAGMSWESYAATLGPIIIGKLPSEMRVEWRKIDKNTFSSFKDLMEFIEAEAEGQEYASIIGIYGRKKVQLQNQKRKNLHT
jgi:hypothetical protein